MNGLKLARKIRMAFHTAEAWTTASRGQTCLPILGQRHGRCLDWWYRRGRRRRPRYERVAIVDNHSLVGVRRSTVLFLQLVSYVDGRTRGYTQVSRFHRKLCSLVFREFCRAPPNTSHETCNLLLHTHLIQRGMLLRARAATAGGYAYGAAQRRDNDSNATAHAHFHQTLERCSRATSRLELFSFRLMSPRTLVRGHHYLPVGAAVGAAEAVALTEGDVPTLLQSISFARVLLVTA